MTNQTAAAAQTEAKADVNYPFNAELRVLAIQPAGTTKTGKPYRAFRAEYTTKGGKVLERTVLAFGDAVQMITDGMESLTGRVVLDGGTFRLIGPAKAATPAA